MFLRRFAEIILPLPLEGTFTYELLDEHQLEIGQRVAVQFGKRKIYTGLVHSLHNNAPERYKTKPIYAILDDELLVNSEQIKFWEWISAYYMCTLGQVFKNVFPTGLKLESDTFVKKIKDKELLQGTEISDDAYLIWEALQNKSLISVQECTDIIDKKTVIPVLKELLDFGLIALDEKLIEKYVPKIDNYIKAHPLENTAAFSEKMNLLSRAPKQRELFLKLLTQEKQETQPIKAADFLKQNGGTYAALRSLEEKGLIEIYQNQTRRTQSYVQPTEEIHSLTPLQQDAMDKIEQEFESREAVLLHGVTSSGKTEIYIKLIQKQLEQAQKVLFLLPEIALTTQLTQRIQKHFGDDVGVYHSKFNQNERVELWQECLNNKYKILIGARSSLFLPIRDLGLIIIDEEHETSLKQTDTAPFYHARDAAFFWAKMNNAKVLLGSATPSLEMYHAAKKNKIGYVELNQRYSGVLAPEIEIIDLKKAYKKQEMNGPLSTRLEKEIRETFANDRQVIIFQNRRGYAPVLECKKCGHTPYCPNCDMALTYHRMSFLLKCHVCGHSQAKPSKCYQCKHNEFETKGLGTEQIEDEMLNIFPDKQIARMDIDSMRRKFAFEKLIESFQNKEVDMLVGTQMVTKGLDFEHVHLVGIVRADNMLNFPDFRAHERAFQRIIQVAGRAGRRKERGKVLIQSFNPLHQVLQNASNFDYQKTAYEILYERKNFHYPPFVRLIQIRFEHSNQERVAKTAKYYTEMLRPYFDSKMLLGPEPPSVPRLKNRYIFISLLKIQAEQSPKKIKKLLKSCLDKLYEVQAFRAVKIKFDVDPI